MAKKTKIGEEKTAFDKSSSACARVTASHGRHYKVTMPNGEVIEAHRRGKRGDVVVGDLVYISNLKSGVAAIEGIAPRRNILYRSDEWRVKTLAANIDMVAVVFASRPSFNPWFIWRALIAAHTEGIPALVVRNKSDLKEGAEKAEEQIKLLEGLGENVVDVSAEGDPEQARRILIERFEGKVVLLVGQSGMGKSTILNLLIPDAKAQTREFSEALDLGKQTTTAARWYESTKEEWNGVIIDTPGFQEFGVAHLSLNDVLRAMPDIAKWVEGCRFANCRHLKEPDCGVKKALEEGLISRERYEFYASIAPSADPNSI